jgi:hypothetical protein
VPKALASQTTGAEQFPVEVATDNPVDATNAITSISRKTRSLVKDLNTQD